MSLGKLSSLELVNSFKKLTNGTFSVVEPSKNKKDVVISTVMPTRVEPDQVQQQQQQHDLDETPEEEVWLAQKCDEEVRRLPATSLSLTLIRACFAPSGLQPECQDDVVTFTGPLDDEF